jgi:hypothetical protein
MVRFLTLSMLVLTACSAIRADRIDESCCIEEEVKVGWTLHPECDTIAYQAMSPEGECFWFACDNAPKNFERGRCADFCEDTGLNTLPMCD